MESNAIIDEEEVIKAVLVTGKGLRFVNFFIDYFAITAIFIMSGSFYQFLLFYPGVFFLDLLNIFLIFEVFYFAYYFIFELLTNGRTLAKYITSTRSVKQYGESTGLSDFAKRSLARCIPFEAFTAFGAQPFHDSIVCMTVIKERKVNTTFYN